MSIVVGFVPTPEGRAALDAAKAEAKERKEQLIVVHSFKGGTSFSEEDSRTAESEAEAIRRELRDEGIDFDIRTLVRGNDPTDDLIETAEKQGASLIVIGLRRRTPIGKLVLGSNAQRILLEAECPVLSVKAARK
ncbi:MAG: universal stress protein [Actinomycetia bacterium]|nr:universal stress protein [Actinomycetes bacterium]